MPQRQEALAAQGRVDLSEAARAMPRTTHNLPFPTNPAFTGRAAELKKLHEELQKRVEVAVTQTVAVHGLGGVGKTQLVVEYAWKHLGDYDAVLWVKADSPRRWRRPSGARLGAPLARGWRTQTGRSDRSGPGLASRTRALAAHR